MNELEAAKKELAVNIAQRMLEDDRFKVSIVRDPVAMGWIVGLSITPYNDG